MRVMTIILAFTFFLSACETIKGAGRDITNAGEAIDDSIAAVLSTSGTTGTPKGAQLTSAALRASATATHTRLGGAGRWLLALPAHHVAGFQVLVRSVVAGTEPVALDPGFAPDALPAAVAALGSGRRYASLVAAQLDKALRDSAAARAILIADDLLDLDVPGGAVTMDGVAQNVDVGLRYIASWLAGNGAAAIHGLMEDAATAEISRSQLWQWTRHGVAVDGRALSAATVDGLIASQTRNLAEAFPAARWDDAARLLRDIVLADTFAPFLTLPAYDILESP